MISQSCPTFSWEGAGGAAWLDLAVYQLDEVDSDAEPGLGSARLRPLIERRLPGGATGWTPALDLCLERGGKYAWSVRAGGPDGVGEWASPSLFELAPSPTREDVEEALRVLRERFGEGDEAPSIAGVARGATSEAIFAPVVAPPVSVETTPSVRASEGLVVADLDVDGTIEGDVLRLGDTGANFVVWEMSEQANNDLRLDYGSEVARVTASGNVGIGTGATVDQKLHVNGTAQVNTLRLEDTAGNGVFWDVAEDGSNNLVFTYIGERLRVSAGGVLRLGSLAASGATPVCLNGNLDLANCGAGSMGLGELAEAVEAQRRRIAELEALLCAQGATASFCTER
jgi:hypothetical protein